MRISTLLELLLILLIIAFAAYAKVIDRDQVTLHRALRAAKQSNASEIVPADLPAEGVLNKLCKCNAEHCECCRDFHVPILRGTGCASVQYYESNSMLVRLRYRNTTYSSNIINGKNPKPICVPMPGGYSSFCGKFYSIKKEADNTHFRACLGLELKSSTDVEAALRVSCFRFGPEGVRLQAAEPLPEVPVAEEEDDEGDIFGFDDDEDDEEEDEEEQPSENSVPGGEDEEEDEDDDLLGFGALFDILTGEDEPPKKPSTSNQTLPPIVNLPAFTPPANVAPVLNVQVPEETVLNHVQIEHSVPVEEVAEDSTDVPITDSNVISEIEPETHPITPESSLQPAVENAPAKLEKKPNVKLIHPTRKVHSKPSITSGSLNAIPNDAKKPFVASSKPQELPNVKPQASDELEDEEEESDEVADILGAEEDEGDEEEDAEGEDSVDDEDDEKENQADEDNTDEEVEEGILEDEDDDENEEEELLTSLTEEDGEKTDTKVANKLVQAENNEEEEFDYDELLSRQNRGKRARSRTSKVMRL